MTDGQMVKVMAHIGRLSNQIKYLMDEDLLDHPNGEALIGELYDSGLGYRFDCTSIAHSHLVHPERWEIADGGALQWKGKQVADSAGEEG